MTGSADPCCCGPVGPVSCARRFVALLAALAMAQTAMAAPVQPLDGVMMTTLCGSGRSVPLPVRRDGDPDGKRDGTCQMACHMQDRRRKLLDD